jgi:hypothetical protein
MSDDDMMNVIRLAVGKDQELKNPKHEDLLAELNRENCVVLDGAKTKVLRFETDEYVAGGERYAHKVPMFLAFGDFRNLYLNRHVHVGKHSMPLGHWWLEHPNRRQYRGVVFMPGEAKDVDGKLNLWTGWGVEPKPGQWDRMREHMFQVLAARDDGVDRYNFNWLAWLVQHPGEQAETATVFIGEPGTGKGTLGKALCRIFGPHALHLSAAEDLTGKFNAHLRQCSFLFGDECYAPQDKRAEGQIKRMITENTLMIEPKGRDKVRVQNRLHVMLASNHDWVVPADAHERRYLVSRVAALYRQDPKWFGPIYEQMQNGGYEAMLFELLYYDLGDWHPRQILRTAALAEQQQESLSPFDAWWLELLRTGVLAGADDLNPDRAISNEYEEEIIERDGYGGERNRTVKREGLYDQAKRISPRLKGRDDAALGRHLAKQGCQGDQWVHRRRGWQFPPLADCRKRWNERYPDTVWDDIKDWTFPKDDPDVAAKEAKQRAAKDPDDDPF